MGKGRQKVSLKASSNVNNKKMVEKDA